MYIYICIYIYIYIVSLRVEGLRGHLAGRLDPVEGVIQYDMVYRYSI